MKRNRKTQPTAEKTKDHHNKAHARHRGRARKRIKKAQQDTEDGANKKGPTRHRTRIDEDLEQNETDYFPIAQILLQV